MAIAPSSAKPSSVRGYAANQGQRIPTGKDFYGVFRAYVPALGAIMKVKVQKQ
jgi:hypothetical protein